jgi:hypothetical protein
MGKTLALVSLSWLAFAANLEAQHVMLRAHAGIGAKDIYGAGGGISATVVTPGGKYNVGGRFTYHTGDTFTFQSARGNTQFDADIFIVAAEFGAQLLSEPVIVRTVGNVGGAWVEVGSSGVLGVTTTTEARLALGPSLLVALPLGGGGFAGIEAKYWNITDIEKTFAIYFTIGGAFGR